MTTEERMTALCRTFPTLTRADGVKPFDPDRLDNWSRRASHGGLYAVRFVLAVWNGRGGTIRKPMRGGDDWRFPVDTPWRCGPFDAVDAMGTWDNAHRRAFAAWVVEPWWP